MPLPRFATPPAGPWWSGFAACRIARIAVGDHLRHDRQERHDDEEAAPLPQLERLGARQPERAQARGGCGGGGRHSTSSRREVIARKRSSSDACTGSSRCTRMPASTSSRLRSGTASASRQRDVKQAVLGRRVRDSGVPRRGAVSASSASSTPIRTRGRPPRRSSSSEPIDDDLAVVDDRDPVARLLDLVEEVRREDHRASLVDERAEQVAELEDAGRVEAVDRLVEDQQLGVGEQAAGDAEALAHAQRVRARRGRPRGAARPTRSSAAVDPAVRLAARAPRRRSPRFSRPVRWRWKRGSSTIAPTRASASARCSGTGRPSRLIVPPFARREAEQHADQRRLAGAVRAEVAERDAARDAQVDAVDGDAARRSASSGRWSR